MFMKRFIFVWLASIQLIFAASYSVQTIEQTPTFLRLKITFDAPQWKNEEGGILAWYEKALYFPDAGNHVVPGLTKFVNLAITGKQPLRILSAQTQTKKVKRYLSAAKNGFETRQVNTWAELNFLGKMGKVPVYALTLFPVRVSADHRTVQYLTSLELTIGQKKNTLTPVAATLPREKNNALLGALFGQQKTIFPGLRPLNEVQSSSASTQDQLTQWQSVLNHEIVFKLSVKEDGIYKVTFDELLKAGFPVRQINPLYLHLYNKGKEVPIYVKGEKDLTFDEGDYLEFWGEQNKKTFLKQYPDMYSDPFSETNVYWLVYTERKGLRLAEESGGITTRPNQLVISPFSFRDTLHFEENNSFQRFGRTYSLVNRPSYEFDHYFYDRGVNAPASVGYDFYLPNPSDYGSEVTVWAMFRGRSYFDAENNPLKGHKVAVKLRGKNNVARLVGEVNPEDGWRDQEMRMISNADSALKIEQSILKNGTNRLEVDMFQTGVTDIVSLNWFEVSYAHLYRADKNYLKFHVDRDFFDGRYVKLGDKIQFNIDGFSKKNIDVYKLGISKIINVDIKPVQDEKTNTFSYGLSFQDEIVDPSVKYVALTDDRKKSVTAIERYRPWDEENPQKSLLTTTNKADYLIITHDLLSKECLTLKQMKEAEGYHVQIVTVRDIYNLFNYGIKSPLAIKDFIRYVYENWDQSAPLQYVVLVGDASSNYYSQNDLVPTIFYETVKYGAAESDYQYALLEGNDYLPEVIVSRIPASTVYELKNYLDKLAHYYQEPPGDWMNRTLFLSGYDGTKEYLTNKPVFRTQSLRLINYRLPQAFFAEQINSIKNEQRDPDPHFGNSRDVIDYFDQGLSFVNFVGHGGGAIWADAGLMGIEEADQLNNGYKLPFIASLTCFTGSFANVGRYSLGEKLILDAQKGAIEFLGSSGVGWIYNDYAIEWGLFDFLWDPDLTMGQAVYLMKIYYLANPFYFTEEGRFYTMGFASLSRSQVSQYNLFGDPALHIVKPQNALSVTVDRNSVLPQDEVHLKIGRIPPAGSVKIEVTDEENYKVWQQALENVGETVEVPFVIPEGLQGQTLRIKVFAGNQTQSAHGSVQLAVGKPIVQRVVTIPENPQIHQPLHFKVWIHSTETVESLSIVNLIDVAQAQNQGLTIPLQKVNDSLFQSIEPFAGFNTGGKKLFDIKMVTASGKTIIEHWKKLTVFDPRPDIAIVPGSLGWQGERDIKLSFKIKNNAQLPTGPFKIYCYDSRISPTQPFDTLNTELAVEEEKSVEAVLPPKTAYATYHQIKVVADPDSLIDEQSEVNNKAEATLFLNYLLLTPQLGTSLDGRTHQKVSVQNSWILEVPPNGVKQNSALRFNLLPIKKLMQQQDLQYLAPLGITDTVGLDLHVLNPSVDSTVQGVLQVVMDSVALNGKDKNRISFYRYETAAQAFLAIPSEWVGGTRLQAVVQGSGLYGIFYSQDAQKPLMEITVNGRPLVGGMLVPKQPTLSILLQDPNGVDLHHSVDLKIDDTYYIRDGVALNPDVSLPTDATSIKNIQITMNPDLPPGDHVLSVRAADANGNLEVKNLEFSVTSNFDIIVYGNYPNPFKEQTIISYLIESNEPIDQLSIKIYSSSGRLVRSKMLSLDETVPDDNILEPNYHELVWDGTDDDGNPVANGVYFAIFKGKYKNKTVKRLLKIARLQ